MTTFRSGRRRHEVISGVIHPVVDAYMLASTINFRIEVRKKIFVNPEIEATNLIINELLIGRRR